jgi:hypothetical protein
MFTSRTFTVQCYSTHCNSFHSHWNVHFTNIYIAMLLNTLQFIQWSQKYPLYKHLQCSATQHIAVHSIVTELFTLRTFTVQCYSTHSNSFNGLWTVQFRNIYSAMLLNTLQFIQWSMKCSLYEHLVCNATQHTAIHSIVTELFTLRTITVQCYSTHRNSFNSHWTVHFTNIYSAMLLNTLQFIQLSLNCSL